MKRTQVVCFLLYYLSSSVALFLSDLSLVAVEFEFMALSAMLIIAGAPSEEGRPAFLHYACMHFLSGVLLLAGASQFASLGELMGLPKVMFISGVLINAASFPMSSWVVHAYPIAPRYGTMILSVCTTKVAAYVLLKMFQGEVILLYLGVATALYGVIFSILEKNVRRILCYNVVGQMGLLLIAIGLPGVVFEVVVGYAVLSILYQLLLFMVVDAVISGTGKTDISQWGSLLKLMLPESLCCAVAVLNMGALPGTAGFVVKSLVLSGSGDGAMFFKYAFSCCSVLLFISVGLKLFWYAFLHKGRAVVDIKRLGSRTSMIVLAATLLILGVFYKKCSLFWGVEFSYNLQKVVTQLVILGGASVCFIVCRGLFKGVREFGMDLDWIYRAFAPAVFARLSRAVSCVYDALGGFFMGVIYRLERALTREEELRVLLFGHGIADLVLLLCMFSIGMMVCFYV